jgi:hypothetical protein
MSLVSWTRIEAEKKNRQTEDDYERVHHPDRISVFEIDRHGAKVGFGNPSSG